MDAWTLIYCIWKVMNIVFYVLRRNWNKRWIFTLLRMMKLDFLYPGNNVRAVWHVTRCQRNPGWNLVRWTAPCGFARIFIGRQCVPSIGRHNIARTWRLGGSRVVPHSCFSFWGTPGAQRGTFPGCQLRSHPNPNTFINHSTTINIFLFIYLPVHIKIEVYLNYQLIT